MIRAAVVSGEKCTKHTFYTDCQFCVDVIWDEVMGVAREDCVVLIRVLVDVIWGLEGVEAGTLFRDLCGGV